MLISSGRLWVELIKGDDITIGYDGEPVVSHLTFSVRSGDYLCIVGENGSGKSTFVKTVLGLIPPLSGQVVFSPSLRPDSIGYLPQKSMIQRDFPSSVMEIVLSGCLNRHRRLFGYSREERDKAESIISRLGLDKLSSSSFQELSGGQQQRTLLARALMATERLLLLDEPVTGLDPQATAELYSIIRKLQEDGITVMMVTHDIHPALNDADMILHFSHTGYYFGSRDEYFRTEPGLKFLKEAGHDHS